MKKIDFKHFGLFTGIEQTNKIDVDVRRDFADLMYNNLNGIVAHDLALRIFRSEGEMTLSDEEYSLCHKIAQDGRPAFFDSFLANIVE